MHSRRSLFFTCCVCCTVQESDSICTFNSNVGQWKPTYRREKSVRCARLGHFQKARLLIANSIEPGRMKGADCISMLGFAPKNWLSASSFQRTGKGPSPIPTMKDNPMFSREASRWFVFFFFPHRTLTTGEAGHCRTHYYSIIYIRLL